MCLNSGGRITTAKILILKFYFTYGEWQRGEWQRVLLYFNEKDVWSNTVANVVIYFLLSWSMITTIINIYVMFFIIVKWIIKKWNKKSLNKIDSEKTGNLTIINDQFHPQNTKISSKVNVSSSSITLK